MELDLESEKIGKYRKLPGNGRSGGLETATPSESKQKAKTKSTKTGGSFVFDQAQLGHCTFTCAGCYVFDQAQLGHHNPAHGVLGAPFLMRPSSAELPRKLASIVSERKAKNKTKPTGQTQNRVGSDQKNTLFRSKSATHHTHRFLKSSSKKYFPFSAGET